MICRTCHHLLPRVSRAALPIPLRAFSTTPQLPNAAAAAAAPPLTPLTPSSPDDQPGTTTPPATLSSCLPGTRLSGLSYFKGREDPVALADDAYPSWLWSCLEVQKKATDESDGVDDEFSKSKKTRRLATKRRLATEAKMLATGNLEALVPKIPLGKQSVNLPGGGEGEGVEEAVWAAEMREELRRALRKERKRGIKESNYLKTM
ncbi:mitochondrial ribosomal protein L37-domain-containing protein [Schizothecium vesticola]|uniref:Large ribosomal subunit protein mL54 n=1 Tax=Schizothecium vesticola TaxID=314040 RepID=A0AA40KCI4_9PEZI|nr:mitochondrial ribosomal protein L37-domain-containing protein [Schizothecium vesticola]